MTATYTGPLTSWMSDSTLGGQNTPEFDNWMLQLTKDWFAAQPEGSGVPNTLNEDSLQRMMQELGEGNQGRTLFNMYQQGLTNDQIKSSFTPQAPGEGPGHWEDQIAIATGEGGAGAPTREWIPDTKYPGAVAQPLFTHSGQTDANTGAFWFDPSSGFVTSPANFHYGGWDKFSDILPYVIMTALTAAMPAAISAVGGAGAGLGQLGNSLFKLGGQAITSGKTPSASSLLPLVIPGYNSLTSGGSMSLPSFGIMPKDLNLGDWGFGDFGNLGSTDLSDLFPSGSTGTFDDSGMGVGFGVDPSGGGTSDWLNSFNFGSSSGSGGFSLPNFGGSSGGTSGGSSGGSWSLPFGLTPQQLLMLGLGGGAALYGSHSTNQAADAVSRAAQQQGQYNIDLARQQSFLNNPNMVTPYGTATYTMGPDGRPTLTQNLSPEEQAILQGTQGLRQGQLGIANAALPNVRNTLMQPFGLGGAIPTADPATLAAAERAMYMRGAQYLDPQFQRFGTDLNTKLANQGIMPGSEAYARAQDELDMQRRKAYADLRDQAVAQGLAAEQAQFNMGLAGRQQGYNEYTQNRTMPLQMLNALLSGSQVNNPQFQPTQPTSIQTAPLFQAGVAGANLQQGNVQNLFNLLSRFGTGFLNQPGG